MINWRMLCQMMNHADRQNEMTYQKYIQDMILEIGLGWHKEQIIEQLSLQLGSIERLVPDIIVKKDSRNCFVIEVKRPGHVKTQKNIDQLISYMKQIETPVGIYWGDELEVYYKNIGDGSQPILLMSLQFKISDTYGEDFVSLFSEPTFSIENIYKFKKKQEDKLVFETNVQRLLKEVLIPDFQKELIEVLKNYLIEKGEEREVVENVLDQINISILTSSRSDINEKDIIDVLPLISPSNDGGFRRNRGSTQRYAYNLIKQIIEKNLHLSFNQLYAIFNKRNHIEDLTQVKDKKRWFMNKEDIITLADGTKVVISNQWGFNGSCKARMDNLRFIARKYGIDDSLHD